MGANANQSFSPPRQWIYRVRYRTYATEVEKSAMMNEALGRGIAVFQGLSNIVLNCECQTNEHVPYQIRGV